MPTNKVGVDDGTTSKTDGLVNPALQTDDQTTGFGDAVSYSVANETVRDEKPGLIDGVMMVNGLDGGSARSVKGDEELGSESGVKDKPYAGMGKEDLLRFSDTVFWNRFRLISILIFWAAWLALLGAVIGLTIVAPRCDDRPTPSWWQKSVIYQIYVRSFYDSDGNGIGDVRGIIEKMDYLEEINVGAILLSSVYESNDVGDPDYGYELLNHSNIRNDYGTISDIEELLESAHNRSISVILDFIPNYTGLDHPWFLEQNDTSYTNPYWNYYVWATCDNTGSNLIPPNNWLSVYGGSAWTWHEGRQQCYLHQFLASQPELNLRSAAVLSHLEEILRFWLNKGVDGFRIVSSDYLVESEDLQDEPQINSPCPPGDADHYYCLNHVYTRSQPEGFDLISRWRDIVNEYTSKDPERPRILITDGDVSVGEGLRYYGRRGDGSNLPINYQLANLPTNCNGRCITNIVQNFTQSLPENATAAWLISSQDMSRLPSAFDSTFVYAVNLLLMTLPGTSLVYYGDELGMKNYNNSIVRDPAGVIDVSFSRDPYRSPMHWNNGSQAGFTAGNSPWLNVDPDYMDSNAGDLTREENSTLNFFKSIAALKRDQESFQYGKIHYLTGFNENLIAYVREHEGFDRFLTVINLGSESVTNEDVTKDRSSIKLPGKAVVVINTHSDMLRKVDDEIDLKKVSLESGQGFIAKWEYSRP